MKRPILALCGLCAAAAGFLVWKLKPTPNIQELARPLEDEWADHRT
jgi:hypothetical protein